MSDVPEGWEERQSRSTGKIAINFVLRIPLGVKEMNNQGMSFKIRMKNPYLQYLLVFPANKTF